MLEVNQLSRKYGDFLAVNNVSFEIGKGEIVGLLGHNGAGKTTIMKMLSGYLEPNAGAVCVDGIDLATNAKAVQRQLGYLPENLPVYPDMSVADYLDFAADLKGITPSKKAYEIQRVVNATDIGSKLLAPIATLSRGFKQRVGVAQAILAKPKLLILDEPTNGLDPEQTQHMRDLILDVAKDATVILSTHIMQEVEAICSRVLMVHGGKLALDAQLKALQQSNHLLVETDLGPAQQSLIESIDNIVSVQLTHQTDASCHYRIEFSSTLDAKNVAAAVAKTLFEHDASVYRLQPEIRDLETLFKEVNEGQFSLAEVQNAA